MEFKISIPSLDGIAEKAGRLAGTVKTTLFTNAGKLAGKAVNSVDDFKRGYYKTRNANRR